MLASTIPCRRQHLRAPVWCQYSIVRRSRSFPVVEFEKPTQPLATSDSSRASRILVKERLAGQRSALLAERHDLPSKISTVLSGEGKRLVESLSNVNGAGQRLLDEKLQEVGDQLGRLEARLREVEQRLSLRWQFIVAFRASAAREREHSCT